MKYWLYGTTIAKIVKSIENGIDIYRKDAKTPRKSIIIFSKLKLILCEKKGKGKQ